MVGLRVTLLGGFEARLGSGPGVRLPTKKAEALLAYLGTRPGHRHSRDKLATLLWGDRSDDQARDGLRHALLALRRALAGADPPPIQIEGQTLSLHPAAVEVDVVTFEQRIAEGTVPALEHAAELYGGDLLLGFNVKEPLFEEWLVAERERLRELALQAMRRLLAHQSQASTTERAIQTAMRLLALDPLQEPVHRALMQLYCREGRRGAALRQYQACVGTLRRELGTEPELETRRLYEELLRRPTAEDRRRPAAAQPDLPAAETPLFGRELELGRLRRLLDEAMRGHGQVVTVLGEAGIGKTRLVSALASDALAQRCRMLIGRCHESDSILPFGPWVDACRSAALGADGEVLGALRPAHQAELARLLPEAGRAGLPPATDSALPLFESVARLIEQVAARQPVMLVLEDLHWADEMSLRLLAFVSRRLWAWSVFLVGTAREEELADASMARGTLQELSRAAQASAIALSPLSRADCALLVQALTPVGTDALTVAHVQERIWAMSEGNPFVAVEGVRSLDRDAGTLPASVRDLVVRRLDRLGARSLQLTAAAAVIGRRFDFALLRVACGMDERGAAEAVEEMVRHRVLQAVGNQLDFTHDRVRDVAYDRLLPPRRQFLHRAVVTALETTGEDIEQLAYHALRGEAWEKAVRYLAQAGSRAAARSALPDARVWFEQALGAAESLPQSRSTWEEAFEIRLALRSVLAQLGEFRRILEVLREAEALAERLNDDGRRGRVCAFVANIQARLGDLDAALLSGERALALANRLGDLRLRILTTTYLAQTHFYLGDYARVVELSLGNLAALPPEWAHDFLGSNQPPAVINRFQLIVCLAHLGRFAEVPEYEAEMIRLAEQTHHLYAISQAYLGASSTHIVKGEWAEAHRLLERLITVLRSGNIDDDLPMALAYSARVLSHLGEAREALERLEESERLLEVQFAKGRVAVRPIYYALGCACLRLGRPDQARHFGRRASEAGSGRLDFMPYALHLLGDIAVHSDPFDPERGAQHYRQALALAGPRGMRPLMAHCHLGLGKLYRRTDQHDHAREHLTTAMAMYRELDMRYWCEQAEGQMGALRVPGPTPQSGPRDGPA